MAAECKLGSRGDFCGDYHVGRVFRENYSSLHLHNYASQPLRKELVFDIDMTDLRESRQECGCSTDKRALCVLCWKRLAMMIHVIKSTLTHIAPAYSRARPDADPQSEQEVEEVPIFCVFSGGRGAHLYLCHQPFCDLTRESRALLIDQLLDKDFMQYDKEVQRTLENAIAEVMSGVVDDQLVPSDVFKEGRIVIDAGATQRAQLTRGIFSPHPTGAIATPMPEDKIRTSWDPAEHAVILEHLVAGRDTPGTSAIKLANATSYTMDFLRSLPSFIRHDV